MRRLLAWLNTDPRKFGVRLIDPPRHQRWFFTQEGRDLYFRALCEKYTPALIDEIAEKVER